MAIRHEKERLTMTGLNNKDKLTLVPLYYAARALKVCKENEVVQLSDSALADVKSAVDLVNKLNKRFNMDEDRDTRNALKSLL